MIKWIITALSLLSTLSFAQANNTWFGNVQIKDVERGNTSYKDATKSFDYNISSYDVITVQFEYYKANVTNSSTTPVWQSVDARAELVQDDTKKVLISKFISVIGSDGNNAVYGISLNQEFNPDASQHKDPEMQDGKTMPAHLNIIIDGVQTLSLAINYSDKSE